jgi:dihydrofolate reductase
MRKLIVFNHVSLDGYFVDANNSMMWAKSNQNDPEWNTFVADNAKGDGTLVFGRVTYQMMASYWPTPMAAQHSPDVAERMNKLSKIVFSRTLDQVSWSNTTLIKGDLVTEMKRLKQQPGEGLAILGSGTIVSQLAQAGLIDEFQVVVNPLVLGKGRTMFEDIKDKLNLKLTKTRAFGNGNVYLCYAPA